MGARPSVRRRADVNTNTEINLIPLMNVFCILIPFLLLTAVFVQLTIINTNLPTSSAVSDKGKEEESPTPEEKKKLNLTVIITDSGFTLAGYGGVLDVGSDDEKKEGDEKKSRKIIPLKTFYIDEHGNQLSAKPEGKKVVEKLKYNYEELQKNLKKIKEMYPGQMTVIILPDDRIEYDVIIQTLDTTREYKEFKEQPDGTKKEIRKELFLHPVLAGGIGYQ